MSDGFRARLLAGELLVGTMVTLGYPEIGEILAAPVAGHQVVTQTKPAVQSHQIHLRQQVVARRNQLHLAGVDLVEPLLGDVVLTRVEPGHAHHVGGAYLQAVGVLGQVEFLLGAHPGASGSGLAHLDALGQRRQLDASGPLIEASRRVARGDFEHRVHLNTRDEMSELAGAMNAMTKGCLAGTGVCFVSHRGEVFPCGYLPVEAGNIRQQPFQEIWEQSPLFADLRDPDLLTGKCGLCEFKRVCSGCRARAYGMTLEYLGEEPFCTYEPRVVMSDA